MLAEAYLAATMGARPWTLNTPILASSIVSFYTDATRHAFTSGTIEEPIDFRRFSRGYYYLGFWIPGAPKMDYKARIKPFEIAIPCEEPGLVCWKSCASRSEALTLLRAKGWPGL
jgi:hypothetical protein